MLTHLIIIGPPGAGKGTLSRAIKNKIILPHISIGKIFRKNIKKGTPLGKIVQPYVEKGLLAPDDITIKLVIDRLKEDDCKSGFILDGFPRTQIQAEKLYEAIQDKSIKVDKIIHLDVADDIVFNRTANRRYCENSQCNAHYNLFDNPPKDGKTCDLDGKNLVTRADDEINTVIKRLKGYHEQTEPAIAFLREKGLVESFQYTNPKGISQKVFETLGISLEEPLIQNTTKTTIVNHKFHSAALIIGGIKRAFNFALSKMDCLNKPKEISLSK